MMNVKIKDVQYLTLFVSKEREMVTFTQEENKQSVDLDKVILLK
jgi:hypothetical protein